MLETKAFAEATAMIVKEHVSAVVAPLLSRIGALEQRPAEPDNVAILRLVQEEVAKMPIPQDGKDADPGAVRSIVAEEIGKAATPILGEVERKVDEAVAKAVAEVPAAAPGKDGKDADLEQVASLVAEHVQRAVAAIPVPQDGKSVGIEDVAPLIEAEVGKAVGALPVPRSIKGVVVDREGKAVFTYSDGSTENIGQVVGRDGTDVDWVAVEVKLRELVAAIPHPKDGKDGRDGFSLDDFDCQPVDERTIKLVFTRGEAVHSYELEFPVPVYRDVFKEGTEYARGDMVTWGGSLFHADRATKAKPETPDSGWRMAVKRGRDGKDAK